MSFSCSPGTHSQARRLATAGIRAAAAVLGLCCAVVHAQASIDVMLCSCHVVSSCRPAFGNFAANNKRGRKTVEAIFALKAPPLRLYPAGPTLRPHPVPVISIYSTNTTLFPTAMKAYWDFDSRRLLRETEIGIFTVGSPTKVARKSAVPHGLHTNRIP